MEPAEWTPVASLPASFGSIPFTADICPGALVRLEAVSEGASAYAARQDGSLAVGYPDIPAPLWEATEVATQGFNAHTAEAMAEARKARQ